MNVRDRAGSMCENRREELSSRLSPVHCTSRLSYPTCEDLGIPFADFAHDNTGDVTSESDVIYPTSTDSKPFKMHGMTYDVRDPNNPFSPYCRIPLPSPFGTYEYGFEPAFIRKRNERERERVRCVNEGYQRLRQHIPTGKKDKRISKVETLRGAIAYIEELQSMLNDIDAVTDKNLSTHARKRNARDRDDDEDDEADDGVTDGVKRRKCSASSGQNLK